jgi:hypothetical protein
MCARGSKSGIKNKTPELPETRESLGKIGIFLFLKSNFPHTKFNFLQWLSAFFNGFLISSAAFQISSMAFCFLQRLYNFFNGFSIFLNGFPLSEKSEKIYLRRQVYERSLLELCISRHSLPELCYSR